MKDTREEEIEKILKNVFIKVFDTMTKEEKDAVIKYCLTVASVIISANVIKEFVIYARNSGECKK